jgi:plastocyanin
MHRRRPLVFTLALAVGLSVSACGGDEPALTAGGGDQGEGHEAQGTVTIAGQEATNHGSTDVTGMQDLEVELDDFYFAPTVLEGEAGQSLTVTLFNEGDAPHTFTVDELDIDQELQPGDEDVTVDVTFPDSGALVFYCRFHADGGMLGGLSVGGDLGAAPGSAGTGGSGEDGEGGSEGSGGYKY